MQAPLYSHAGNLTTVGLQLVDDDRVSGGAIRILISEHMPIETVMLCGETTTFHVARPLSRPSVTVHTLRGDEMRVLSFGVFGNASVKRYHWSIARS